MPTNESNERFDWGPYSQVTDPEGWAEDREAEDGKAGLAELLDRAEQQMTVKDAEANIQNWRPLPGRTFECTDVEREYVGDGTAWNQRVTRGPNPTFESATVNGPADVDSLLVGATGPVSGIVGDSDEYEFIGCCPLIPLNSSQIYTTSTTYVQPYGNSNRIVVPHNAMSTLTGISSIELSLTGRLSVDTGQTMSVIAKDIENDVYMEETEHTSSVGAGFERFHSARGPVPTAVDIGFIGYEVKVSGGEGATYGPVLACYWRKIA